jgi:hypothetical protein
LPNSKEQRDTEPSAPYLIEDDDFPDDDDQPALEAPAVPQEQWPDDDAGYLQSISSGKPLPKAVVRPPPLAPDDLDDDYDRHMRRVRRRLQAEADYSDF